MDILPRLSPDSSLLMKTNYVLIDYENVQPKNLAMILDGGGDQDFRVLVFVGANQTKIPIELAEPMQRLGNKAKYITMSGSGKNALDFHIAYYLGELAERHNDGYFHIIAKDTGYDQLIKHLKGKQIHAARHTDIALIPLLSSKKDKSQDEQVGGIVKNLKVSSKSRPRKMKTLTNHIKSLFGNQLDAKQVAGLIGELQKQGYVVVDDKETVTYRKM